VEAVISEDSLSAIAEGPAVVEPVKRVARRRAKRVAKKVVSKVKGRSLRDGEASLSAERREVSAADAVVLSHREISADELLLNTIRDKVLGKLDQGEMELKVTDGLRAVELKNKICGGTDYQGVLKELLEEIRKEALKGY